MEFCAVPTELPVQLPEKADGLYYCPVLLKKVKKGAEIGYADPTFVVCKHLDECKALHASIFNHNTSKKNTHYRAYPDRTASEVRADGFPVVNHRTSYPKDYALKIKERQREEGE